MPDRYLKRPVRVHAEQYDGSTESANRILGWIGSNGGDAATRNALRTPTDPASGAKFLDIRTLEGTMTANPGDWIIRGVQGEFYPVKPAIFAATYEPATPDTSDTSDTEEPA